MKTPKRLGIGIFVAAATSYGRTVIDGAQAYGRQRGAIDFYIETDMMRRRAIGDLVFAKRQLDLGGMLADIWSAAALHAIQNLGIPVVDVNGAWGPAVPSVHVDNVEVGRMVARHLLEKGLVNFAFQGSPSALQSHQRRDAFRAVLRQAGFSCATFDSANQWAGQIGRQERSLEHWLAGLPKPVGLLCWNDFLARQTMYACQAIGAAIPQEVSIVGVDNDELASQMCPVSLSSVDVAPWQIGFRAMALLDRLMRGAKAPRRHISLPPAGLVSRTSSDMMAVPNADIRAAVTFIQKNADQPIEVRDVVREAAVSRRSLEMHFRKYYGCTPRQHIWRQHVEHATMLLVKTDLGLTQVAEKSGFKTASHFWAFFKRSLGMTPREYRRKHRTL